MVCRLASIQRSGTFSTKKGAKQLAASAMLSVVQNQLGDVSEANLQIATVDSEPADQVIKRYRDLKMSDKKHVVIRLSDRHKYFMRFSPEKRAQCSEILYSQNMFQEMSNRDLVHSVCNALKIKYEFCPVRDHPSGNFWMFVLQGEYDCVRIGPDPDLWEDLVGYFKTMFNFY